MRALTVLLAVSLPALAATPEIEITSMIGGSGVSRPGITISVS